MAHSLSNIIDGLRSDKVKPRQDALAFMDEALANDEVVDRLSGSIQRWLAVFQALFLAVAAERASCVKKGLQKATATSISRLEKAGSVVRNGTQRNIARLPYKVVQHLLEHLMNSMVDKARDHLLAPLSLNYIKSIVVICSHDAHLDHLDSDLWISLVSLAFAVILDDSLLSPRGFGENYLDESDIDVDMEVDEINDNNAGNDGTSNVATGSKRARPRSPLPDTQPHPRSKTPTQATRTMSQEQIEFMGLLVILLRSPHAPYLRPGIAQNILKRIRRFFAMYPSWSVAHTNAVVSINLIFSQVELNLIKTCAEFASRMWSPLLSYWNGKEKKDKRIREELMVTMTTFFPLVMSQMLDKSLKDHVPALVDELFRCFQDDIDRSVFEGLSLDSLRLHLHEGNGAKGVFEAATFRSGYKFEASQALSWTILELHADVARELHLFSESYDGYPEVKRRRRETPLSEILSCIRKEAIPPKRRSECLQVLLFIIDRHWADLHDGLQQDVSASLLILLAHDDLTLQSWVFLCLAAIAAAPGTVSGDSIEWNVIWSQAIHRTNVLGVGRAASHAAHVLLASQRLPLHRILPEIETFAANLVIQGPAFPFDSVCAFLCDCLRLASQDMRLYRIQLSDKVLGWLSQSWSMVGPDFRQNLPLQAVSDILALLEATCGFSQPSRIYQGSLLPDSVLTDTIIERHRTAAYRDYLLNARLRPFEPPDRSRPHTAKDPHAVTTALGAPNPRETKVSALLLKSLELLCGEWRDAAEAPMDATPEKIRRSFDAAVIALCFQASLVCNGTQSNRRVIQIACKLVTRIQPYVGLPKWKPIERAMILMGLDPLISDGHPRHEDDPWDLLLGPVKGSGVGRITLVQLSVDFATNSLPLSSRRELQSVLWKSVDVQEAFEPVMIDLRRTLQLITASSQAPIRAGEEEDEDFALIQVANTTPSASRAHTRAKDLCVQVCVAFLATAPILQSGNRNTHDKDLVNLLLKCEAFAFLALAPEFLQAVRNRQLYISIKTAESLTDRLEEVLSKSYNTNRSVEATLLAIQFLHSTSHLWLQATAANAKLSRSVRLLHDWLSNMAIEGNLPSWRIRDRLVCYLDHYLSVDPHETFWSSPGNGEDEDEDECEVDEERLPSHILPKMGDDEDARVRFRVAVANGRLLCTTEVTKADAMSIYVRVKQRLSVNLSLSEHMFTRFIYLGNAMIVSSAVRRGPYWHLLETCLYAQCYRTAVEAVLSAAAARLGLPDLKSLFKAYASQLVESLMGSEKNFFCFPLVILGYDDWKQCGHETFQLLAPMVRVRSLMTSPNSSEVCRRAFLDHCHIIEMSEAMGVSKCFADVVANTILFLIANRDNTRETSQLIAREIENLSASSTYTESTDHLLRQHLDRVVFSIIRTVNATDHSKEGAIIDILKNDVRPERAVATFAALNAYRNSNDFIMHLPNTPMFDTLVIWQSLMWLEEQVGGVFTVPIVYHVVHHLFAAVAECPLVNEQLRLLHGLIIWISVNVSSFRNITLLRTLLCGAIILLSQSDLAHIAQGIIGWTFGHYRSLNSVEPTFPDLMGRIARISHDYSRNSDDTVISSLGVELLDWIEKEAWMLSQEPSIHDQILDALPLWPRQPKGNLAHFVEELNKSKSLSDVLHGTSGKFRLVRRLRDLTGTDEHSREQFCGRDFWHLKNCIPEHGEIQDEDIDAFVDLIYKHAAQIRPLDTELVTANLVTSMHVNDSRGKENRHKAKLSPRRSIVLALFNMLSTEVAAQIHRAHTTLRRLLTLPITELQSEQAWPQCYRDEISYLRTCPPPPATQALLPVKDLTLDSLQLTLQATDFPNWICQVATLLNNVLSGMDSFYAQLSPSIQFDPSFATQMLPVLVHSILLSKEKDARSILSKYFSLILTEGTSPQRSRSIVDTLLHLRNFPSPSKGDPLAHDKWLDVDFRLLSRGALSCGAYTTALLFLELAADYSRPSREANMVTEETLYDIYNHIEEPDGFYAIKSSDVHGFLTKRLHHEGQWDMVFKFHAAEFDQGSRGSRGAEGIYESLHSNGYDKLAVAVIGSSTLGPQYEAAWRTQQWDLPEPSGDDQAGSALYSALRAIHRSRDTHTVDALLRTASRNEMARLFSTGNEDMVGIRTRLQTLMSLGEIKKWRAVAIQDQLSARDISPGAWGEFLNVPPDFDFRTLESIISTRMSLLGSTKQREQRDQIGDLESPFMSELKHLEQKCFLKLSEAARMSGHHDFALNAVMSAKGLERIPSFEVSQEFAHVLWLLKEHKPAVEYLSNLVDAAAPMADCEKATKDALALARLGTWSAEACLQKPTDIREHFFARATNLLLGSESQELAEDMDPALAVVFQQYALFAEEQYHANLRSPEISRLKVYMERKKLEIEQVKSLPAITQRGPKHDALSSHLRTAEALFADDTAQLSIHTESRTTFLVQAVEMYSRCLHASDEFDDSAVIRLCSLWFANFGESKVQHNFGRALSRIPSRKFVFLAHQLSARLSRPDKSMPNSSNSPKHLKSLMVRMCNEHPFHCLYQVWALQSGAPESAHDGLRRQSSRGALPSGRAETAREIITLCRQYTPNTQRVQSLELLCNASLQWAKYPLKTKKEYTGKEKTHDNPSDCPLRRISDLAVPVTTAHTPLDPTLRYDDLVTVKSYLPRFTLAGGKNLPKISVCVGSDGKHYKQLFKGEGGDDLRQDAVMEQVFELVNIVLKRDRHTRKRQLRVRGYKVIPLAPQAGLLEYVEGTMPIGEWLSVAHKRYRPGDLTIQECHSLLQENRLKCGTKYTIYEPVKMRDLFLEMLEKFRPVFRHFFTESYKLPMVWFSNRLRYARSAATTSIVGHILGLGDRHVSNILIDKTNGELVHIDLGIAFDQGKLLPVPELVPFRLTADIVDGLGTAGTEGVFRRCAEETLRVLRAESGVITTVLEVFRHDPLHSWTASAIKINRIQAQTGDSNMTVATNATVDTTGFGVGIDMNSDAADESADRALTGVRQKLDQSLSVEYTVNELITTAADPMNICQIFFGMSIGTSQIEVGN
ncbi:hypothetical protein K439DRAFT_1395785 [Ramaria rubella]|nr:hypothetical protein K439DRAFT_1395785 [Ramaria rubella]